MIGSLSSNSRLVNRPVTDTLLRAAEYGLYRVHWTQRILDETTGSLIKRSKMNEAQASHLQEELTKAFPEAMVNVPAKLIEQMTNDDNDRHVAAAAVIAQAQVIVTFNLSHFQPIDLALWNLEAMHPDVFLSDLVDLDSKLLKRIILEQSQDLTDLSPEDLLSRLEKHVPNFVSLIS
ncbi:MAG TPA: PIN domain-containing protein [Candidatus Melainabacteria bacterium]|nr:PIN domain-containing protein [Candidatus Melainabacteria bacterium]